MSDETQSLSPSSPSPEERLETILAEYLRGVEQGLNVDQQALIAAYPDLADDLREFFSNQIRMQRLVGESPQASRPGAAPTKLRYFGDYEILEVIAQGGMGVVYKARQTTLNRIVAVKMILAGQLANDSDVKRFQAEAQAAANLHHPGIVGIYEVGEQDGQHYFSMEYIDGRNLAQLIREKPIPVFAATEYVQEVARVLEYAHQKGILHRDIKPSNILVDDEGRVRVTDFGLAKRVEGGSDLTMTGQVLGTPSYMSPEQAAAQHAIVGPATDIYALGAILYELITGRPPFRSESIGEILRQVQHDEPVQPRLLNPKLPRDLETICLKCLEKEPRRRYASARELADDLGRYLRGEPILARPIRRVSRAWRWCKRKPIVAGLSAVSVMASLGAVTVLLVSHFLITKALGDRTSALSKLTTANLKLAKEERNVRDALTGKTVALGELEKSNQSLRETVDREQQANYYNHVLLAWREWQAGHVTVAENHLNACRPDLRSWEWHYIARLCRPSTPLASLEKVKGIGGLNDGLDPPGVRLSRDGTRLAYILTTRTVAVLDATTGKELVRIDDAGHDINCLALSPEGGRLAALGEGSLTIWDTTTKRVLRKTSNLVDTYNRLEFSASGDRLIASEQSSHTVSGEDSHKRWGAKHLAILDGESSRTLAVIGFESPLSGRCLHSADGRQVAKLHQRFCTISRIDGGKTIDLAAHDAGLAGGAFSSDGTRFATFDSRSTIVVWDTATGSRLSDWHVSPEPIERIAFSPDGSKLAAVSFLSNLSVWDANGGKLSASFREMELERMRVSTVPTTAATASYTIHRFLAFSPGGTRLASASGDHKVTVWDLGSGRQTALRSRDSLCFAAFMPGEERQMLFGTHLNRSASEPPTSNSSVSLNQWNLLGEDESRLIFRRGAFYHTVAVNHLGTRIASVSKIDSHAANARIKVWDAQTGKEVLSVPWAEGGEMYDVAFSPDDSLLAITGNGGIGILDLATKELRRPIKKTPGRCHRASFCKDGKRLLVAHIYGAALYDLQTGQEAVTFQRHLTCTSAVLNEDESRVATGCQGGGKVAIWNAHTGEQILDLTLADEKRVHSVAYSPDSKWLAAAFDSGRVCVWNALTGKQIHKWLAHAGRAYTVAFSSDGKRLISMGDDGVLRVWESKTAQEILTLTGHADRVYSATFTHDGSRIVSTSADGTIRIWDGSPLPANSLLPPIIEK
jgi:eukaryotic-like serine/threonine-protein kinase